MVENEPQAKWYHSVWVVLLLLFFVLGPFGLPMLWKSPHFSKLWKQILTVVTLLYTAACLWVAVSTVQEALRIVGRL